MALSTVGFLIMAQLVRISLLACCLVVSDDNYNFTSRFWGDDGGGITVLSNMSFSCPKGKLGPVIARDHLGRCGSVFQ